MKRTRVDELLVARGLASDEHEAQALIMAGKVRGGRDDSMVVDKPGMLLDAAAPLSVKSDKRFVSRGGYKLEGALDAFSVDVSDLRCIDVGASTGGFTDCLLQRGAASVTAVDVGYGQLADKLRRDERVEVFDRINIRTLDPEILGPPFDLLVADLSFISIAKVAHALARFVSSDGRAVLLVKPQFEARREEVGEGGIIDDSAVHMRCLTSAIRALAEAGLATVAVTISPIKGAAGNTEFLLSCVKNTESDAKFNDEVRCVLTELSGFDAEDAW